MMPGETHPAAPGTAADLSRCQGCASLQQNLNEYVEALITLKQKIINTDNLLTEYQKKCDELQFARRENTTLHHQVEQMLQKISPLQKCQEELGSLKAELEEKKSSLKLYQDTHQEYARVKEECLKSDAQKKKLEAKVKKLEEAAMKQIQDFKQLRNEKKILEKEFKKTQERLDEVAKQKNEKELRHIGTQISSDSYGSIDKKKVKLLLKELWLCVNTTHRFPGEGRCVQEKPAKENTRSRAPGEEAALLPAQGSPLRTSDVQTCFTKLSMEIQGDFSSCENVEEERPVGANYSADHVVNEDKVPGVLMQGHHDGGSTGFFDQDHFFDEDLQAAIDFFKLPPPLLSPVPSPPLACSPHLGSLPSVLTPETCFGEYTDSSDNDSVQLKNSAESVSEDDITDAQDYFGPPRKNKGSAAWAAEPKPPEAFHTLKTSEVNTMTTVGFETLTATLREPSTTYSLPHEKHWTVSSEFVSGGKRVILHEAKGQKEVREVEKSVQTEDVLCRPATSPHLQGWAGSLAPQPGPASWGAGDKLTESTGTALLSRMTGLPKSELTKGTQTHETTSRSDCVTVSNHFQSIPREMGKQRTPTQGFSVGESDPDDDVGDAADAAGLDAYASFSSSSTSTALSDCTNAQSSPGLERATDTDIPTEAPTELPHSQQHLQPRAWGMSDLQSEPPACPLGGSSQKSILAAASPELGASDVSGQKSSETETTKVVTGTTKIHSLSQSLFVSTARDGQCERQDARTGVSDFTPFVGSRAGLIRSGLDFVRSASWHCSALLRSSEESPTAKSEHDRKTTRRLEEVAPSLPNGGLASKLELPRQNSRPVEFTVTSPLLPNQVSVITKQARPGRIQSAKPELPRPRGHEPACIAAEHSSGEPARTPAVVAEGGGRGELAQHSGEVAAREGASLDVSNSRRKLDFSSPSGSLPTETLDHPTDSKLAFCSENIPVQNQDVAPRAAVQEAAEEQQRCSHAPDPDERGGDGMALTAAGSPPAEEASCGDTGRLDDETLALPSDSPGTPQSAPELVQLKTKTPGASPEFVISTGTVRSSAFSRKDGETQDLSQSRPSGPLHCYTGIREGRGEDTEVEDSEAFSCSEGEPEPVVGSQQRDAPEDLGSDLGGTGTAVAGARPSLEVGFLTSALQDFNISTFSEIDRLSTSEVVRFLESCQLRDYSSGDSVSECSSKGTLNKEMNKELKQNEMSEETYGKQPCEEILGTSEEWIESEEEDYLKSTAQLAQCSLDALSEVLTKIGQDLQANCEECDDKDAENLLLLNIHNSMTDEHLEETVPPHETAQPSGLHPLTAGLDSGSSSPTGEQPPHENMQSRLEEDSSAAGQAATGEEVPSGAPGPPAIPPEVSPAPATEQAPSCEADATFQCQISTVTSEVINVLINKDQNLLIEKGDNWTIISGVAVMPSVDQVILCDTPGEGPASQDQAGLEASFKPATSVEKSPEAGPPSPPCQEPPCGSYPPCTQEDVSSSSQSTNFDKSRLRNRPVKPSVRISSQIYDQDFESQTVATDHTYYNSRLEPFSKNKSRSKIPNKDHANKSGKTSASSRLETHQSEVSQSFSGERGHSKAQRNQTQTVLANADTSTPTDHSLDTLSKIRQEVGPPLPPLLAPLIATPPRTSQPLSPLVSSASPSSPASPGQTSPLGEISAPPVVPPRPRNPRRASPPHPSPSPSSASASERIVSSPLQFCAATPKHALPVPGRLPPCASGHSAVGGPQENSVKILDTMYPELSARARTLSLLKGNLQLTRGAPTDCTNVPGPVSTIIGFKAITSTSTAFVKTGGNSGGDCNQDKSRDVGTQDSSGKRTLAACTLRSAKRLRLDSGSPEPETRETTAGETHENLQRSLLQAEVAPADKDRSCSSPAASTVSQLPLNPKETEESEDEAIASALKKIAESSFDLLPVIRSHVYVGNISKKPVMRDQEKEVVFEFSTTKKHLAECLLDSILSELKIQKMSVDHNYIHALCRVYVGICRQLGDLERARLFCYSLLKEDFPESEKLTLFIANMWHDIFISQSVINKAMQLVARQRAKGEVLNCLRAFLNWEKNAPVDVGFMVSKLLLTIQLCPKTEFQSSEKFGEDLSDNTWEYIFAIDLLCCHQKWIWTHDNIISKELWPVMDKWIKYRKGHANIAYTPDIIIASILRLIGRLGQLGLKEGFPSAVKNISSVIGMFIQHAQDEDIPWGIQLAAVYALCDLSPSNPAETAKILEAWRRETSKSIPSAVVSYLEDVGSLSAEGLG